MKNKTERIPRWQGCLFTGSVLQAPLDEFLCLKMVALLIILYIVDMF